MPGFEPGLQDSKSYVFVHYTTTVFIKSISGVEPKFCGLQPHALPLDYIDIMDILRIELRSPLCKRGMLPLNHMSVDGNCRNCTDLSYDIVFKTIGFTTYPELPMNANSGNRTHTTYGPCLAGK